MSLTELKKDLKQKKVIFGTERTIKNLKFGKLTRIYLSSNCPEDVKRDVTYYSKLTNVEVIQLKETNEELGTICRKPFLISVLSFVK